MSRLAVIASISAVGIIAFLAVLLALAKSDLATIASDNRVLQSDNTLQGQVIASQAFNVQRFNTVAAIAAQTNQIAAAGAEKTVIEYREILRREKTCDLPVPDTVADGLLKYANSLRTRAMHPDSGRSDAADVSPTSTSGLTYCQAVLWISPLLAIIEQGNRNFAGIRQIEDQRKHTSRPDVAPLLGGDKGEKTDYR